MPPSKHAVLSASGAHRWLHCNPSARLELEFADRETEAAAEGTAAHALAEHKLKKALKLRSRKPVSPYDCDEMDAYTDGYVEFVLEQLEEAKTLCADPLVLIEQRLDFSCYVPDGFGGFVRLRGDEKDLQRALYRLTCRRGALCFLPRLGSRLYRLGREKTAARDQAAMQMAAEALADMDVTVVEARVRNVSDDQVTAEFTLRAKTGAQTAVEVTV